MIWVDTVLFAFRIDWRWLQAALRDIIYANCITLTKLSSSSTDFRFL